MEKLVRRSNEITRKYQLYTAIYMGIVSMALIVMDCVSKVHSIAKWADIAIMLISIVMFVQALVHFTIDYDVINTGNKFKIAVLFAVIQLIENIAILVCLVIDTVTIEGYTVFRAFFVFLCGLMFECEIVEYIASIKDLRMESKIGKDIKKEQHWQVRRRK